MLICLLSDEEAGRLENYGDWPQCKNHHHASSTKVLRLAEAGLVRFLGGPGTKIPSPVSMVVASKQRQWQPVPCANTDGSQLLGMRIWGNARA